MIDYEGLREDVYPSFFNCNHCNCNQQPLFLPSSIRPSIIISALSLAVI
jgi:hypothetical protein